MSGWAAATVKGGAVTGSALRWTTGFGKATLRNPILPLLMIVIPAFCIFVPHYATSGNIQNLALQSSVLLLLVGGGSIVVISGNFDLSSEGTLAFTAVLSAWLVGHDPPAAGWGLPAVLVIAIAIAAGAGIGLLNGLLVEWLGVNPFIVTLGGLLTLKGAAALPTKAGTVFGLPNSYNWPGRLDVLGVSYIVIIACVLYTMLALYLRYSLFGRHLYAVGANKKAARENGISPLRVIVAAYMLSGGLAAVGGWLAASRLDSASPLLGDGIIFTVFAAFVIGGVSLTGGRGGLAGAAGGVLLLGSIENVLNLIALNPLYVDFVRGLVILVAIILIVVRQRVAARMRLGEVAA